MARILIVEDDEETREAIAASLNDLGHDVAPVVDARSARSALSVDEFDVLMTDIRIPGETGIDLCAEIAGNHPDVPVILMTAFGDSRAVAMGLQAGCTDFLPKPFTFLDLERAVDRALERRERSERVIRLPAPANREDETPITNLIGASTAMRDVQERIRQVASHQAPILITGETGTGKELVARAIHALSPRSGRPFLALNCAAIPLEMIESELFGHAHGAFTGAVRDTAGVFRSAEGGTLLLDEIGAMPLNLQARLLRALEERSVRPVGTVDEVAIDVRVIAATNVKLREAASSGKFRSDLLFRLSTFEIELPPLHARGDDIVELARYLRKFSPSERPVEFTAEALVVIRSYTWPGNVRELENAIRAAVAVCGGSLVRPSDLPTRMRGGASREMQSPDSVDLAAVERRHIERVLKEVGGNRSAAARKLGIDRVTLYRKMKRYRFD